MINLDLPLAQWHETLGGWELAFSARDTDGWLRDFTAFIEERVDGLFTGCIANAEFEYALSPEIVGAWSTPEGAADALRRMWREA